VVVKISVVTIDGRVKSGVCQLAESLSTKLNWR